MTSIANGAQMHFRILNVDFLKLIGRWTALLLLTAVAGCKTATMAYQEKPADDQLTSIQSNLIALNYLDKRHLGSLNAPTEAAIRAFQKDNGLPIDGKLSASVYVRSSLAVNKKNEQVQAEQRAAKAPPALPPGIRQAPPVATRSQAPGSTNSPNAEPSACRFAEWEGTVNNLADLFVCNESRAIASLSAGRRVALKISSVSFAGGKLRVESRMQLAALKDMGNQMQKNFSWNTWMQATQSADIYTFTCIMDGSRAANLKVGSVVQFQAKLQSWASPYGQLTCS